MTNNYQLSDNVFQVQFENVDFVLKTQQQIAKDFERSGHDIDSRLLDNSFSLEELEDIVALMLSQVFKKGEQTTLQLLYQIDIPQSQFLQLSAEGNFLNQAAYLIIRREAQKVYLRSIL